MEAFWEAWQHLPEKISPVLVSIGSFQIRYYGLTYVVAFLTVYLLVAWRIRYEKHAITLHIVQDYLTWAILALVIGGRLGYVLFYDATLLSNPLEIFLPFEWQDGLRFTGLAGMSYHGGLVTIVAMSYMYCRKHAIDFTEACDLLVPVIPLAYAWGRLGNFLNHELYGRVTTANWGMYFPTDFSRALRHPSQLYEMFFEGIFLFLVLWCLRQKSWMKGKTLGFYIFGYGCVRFGVEFFRQPDFHLGFVLGEFTMGQVLCLGMMIIGLLLLIPKRGGKTPPDAVPGL